MGLLDSLRYDQLPSGGLLDLLRSLQGSQGNAGPQNIGYGQGDLPPEATPLPSQIQAQQAQQQSPQQQSPILNQNQPSPLDSAQWPYGPGGAPSGAMAQMPQSNAPPQPQAVQQSQQAPPQAGGIGDNLMAGAQSWANTPGGLIGRLANGLSGLSSGQRTDPTAVEQQRVKQVANVTMQALINKGIDPATAQAAIGSPDLLKALVAQAYGPQTIQNLGSGYVADKNGKITRAYEPEDKIPAGFAKGDDGIMKFIPGGPADPAYLRLAEAQKKDPNANLVLGRGGEIVRNNPDGTVTVVHKNQDGAGDEASIDDKTATLLAGRVLQGDTKALVGLGRGAQGAANILKIHKLASEMADKQGIDAKGVLDNIARQAGLVSSARALGTKETHFGVAEKAMEESLPLAQAASDAVPRSNWVGVNKLIQMGQTQHADPTLKRFLIATDTAAKDYARTINPTGALRESDIEYARKILSTADGPEAYSAALDQLRMEAGVMHRAISRQKEELLPKQGGAKAEPTPKAGSYIWSPSKGLVPHS